MKISRGFTLIELMVVISIISLLSSIVLVSISTTREKARFAAAKVSYRNFQNILIPKAIVKFDFNNNNFVSGDSANPGVAATTTNTTGNITIPDSTLFKTGSNLSMNGNGTPPHQSLTLIGTTGLMSSIYKTSSSYNYTLGTWYNPSVFPSSANKSKIISVSTSYNRNFDEYGALTVNVSSSGTVCITMVGYGTDTDIVCSYNYNLQLNKWHYIVASIKKINGTEAELKLNIDGKEFKATITTPPPYSASTNYGNFGIGGNCCYVAQGLYDEAILADITY